MNDDFLDSKGKEVREVYARFGLAIYTAQCLEHGLVNALIYVHLIPTEAGHTKDWESRVDSFASEHFKNTLGRLILDLKKVSSVPTELEESLASALRKRNWLAHDYFRERATDFLSREGRLMMIDELDAATNQFNQTDELLSDVLSPLLQRYGITEELIAKMEEEIVSNAQRKSTLI